MVVATVSGAGYQNQGYKWQFNTDKLKVNDINVVYSLNLDSYFKYISENVVDAFVVNDKLLVLQKNGNEFQLSYGFYMAYDFYLEKIDSNVEINTSKITSIVSLSNNPIYGIYFVSYSNDIMELGDIFITNQHDSVWNLTLSNVILTRKNNDFYIDVHKVVYYLNLVRRNRRRLHRQCVRYKPKRKRCIKNDNR
jgi:hypothetical protein